MQCKKRLSLYRLIFYERPLWFSSSIVCLVKSVFPGCWADIRTRARERLRIPCKQYSTYVCIIELAGKLKVVTTNHFRSWSHFGRRSLPPPPLRQSLTSVGVRHRRAAHGGHFPLCGEVGRYTVKKAFRNSRPQPGYHLPNSPWAGIIYIWRHNSRPGEFSKWHPGWGDGNAEKLFYGVGVPG
jgi:hypothetical protein